MEDLIGNRIATGYDKDITYLVGDNVEIVYEEPPTKDKGLKMFITGVRNGKTYYQIVLDEGTESSKRLKAIEMSGIQIQAILNVGLAFSEFVRVLELFMKDTSKALTTLITPELEKIKEINYTTKCKPWKKNRFYN